MLTYPVTNMNQVNKFDEANGTSTYIYLIQGEHIQVYHLPKKKDGREVLLGLVVNEKNQCHYVLIKDISRVISHLFKSDHKEYFCKECFYHTRNKVVFDRHVCFNDKVMVEFMPPKTKKGLPNLLKFKNYKHMCYEKFVVFADMESILKKVESEGMIPKHIPVAVNSIAVFNDSCACYGPYISNDPYELMKIFIESLKIIYRESVLRC